LRQAVRRRSVVHHRAAAVRGGRGRHRAHPDDRSDRAVHGLRRFLPAGQLHPDRDAAAGVRRGPPPAGTAEAETEAGPDRGGTYRTGGASPMNKPLRRVALVMMAMVVLLMGNATYIQVIKADEYRKAAGNQRTLYDKYSRERGQIIAGGQSLAHSVPADSEILKYQRKYPNGPMFAPVTGFYSFYYGSNGIERAEDDILNGTDDSLAFDHLADIITGEKPRGGNVELTIDPAIQQVAYEQLTSKGFQGSVVALNPSTGEI